MNADRLSSLFWFALGALSMYAARKLGLGTPAEPGSGFMPFSAGAFICLMAVLVFAQSFAVRGGAHIAGLWKGLYWRRSLAVGIVTLGFIATLESAGFFLVGFALLVATMRGLERLSWRSTLVISVLTLLVSYLVFKVFLKATLPSGILGF